MNPQLAFDVQLSVIVPAYNEEDRIESGIKQILEFLQSKQKHTWELIVVDDGSEDNTCHIIDTIISGDDRARLIRYRPNRGKGFAVRTGVLDAVGEWVVFLDADLSTPVDEIYNAIELLERGADLVVGTRAHPDSCIEVEPSLFRRIASYVFDLVRIQIVGLSEFSDTQCGFKAARGQSVVPLYKRAIVERFMFDVEILFLARQAGLNIEELPIIWRDSPGSTVRLWPGVYEMFRDLLAIRKTHG
jgi:dolichyl-phosphate beta-glucosyltransferase